MLHLIRHARIYSPEPLGVRDLLVAGGQIAWIGEDADLPPRLGAVTRDLEGRRVVPGLVDCHVHLTGGGGEAGYGTSVPPLPVEQFTRGGITSVVGLMGNAGQANYAAAKAGLIGFTKSLARELASRNVTANVVAPGFVETAMTAALPEETRTRMFGDIPAGRFGGADEIAAAVVYLASEEAAYVTGRVLNVSGGLDIRAALGVGLASAECVRNRPSHVIPMEDSAACRPFPRRSRASSSSSWAWKPTR